MTVVNMVQAINAALAEQLDCDDRVMLLGQDIGRNGGVFRATEGLQAKYGAHRVVDTPLAEGAIVGAAVGLAISGMVPVAEIQFLGFAHQAYHQIADQVARFRHRSRGRYTVPLVIRAPYGGGVRTPELHSDALEAQYAHCPGLKVVAPSNPYDAKGMLVEAIRSEDPVLFCEPLRGYRLVKGEVPDGDFTVPLGSARVCRSGHDVTLIAWSASVQRCEQAATVLAGEGIDAGVLDLRSLVPLDIETLASTVAATGRAVVMHEAVKTGGYGGEVIAPLNEECFYDLLSPIERVTPPDVPYPLPGAESHYLPDVDAIVAAARKAMQE